MIEADALKEPAVLKLVRLAEEPQQPSWNDYLFGLLDPKWRPNEWNHKTWIFVGDSENPDTLGRICRRQGCSNMLTSGKTRCTPCGREAAESGVAVEDLPIKPPREWEFCSVEAEGERCGRVLNALGLCNKHYHSMHYYCRQHDLDSTDPAARAEWARVTSPRPLAAGKCAVAICDRPGAPRKREQITLCLPCARSGQRAISSGRVETLEEWATKQSTNPRGATINLSMLPVPLRYEIAYAMQKGDENTRSRFDIYLWGRAVAALAAQGVPSMTLMDAEEVIASAYQGKRSVGPKFILLRSFALIDAAQRAHAGADPGVSDALWVHELGLRETKTLRNPNNAVAPIDLLEIPQTWLREAFRWWVLDLREPYPVVKQAFDLCRVASGALSESRADNGHLAEALDASAMTTIIHAFNDRWASGTVYSKLSLWWASWITPDVQVGGRVLAQGSLRTLRCTECEPLV